MLKLAPAARVLDLDGSVTRQQRLLLGSRAEVVDLRSLAPSVRYLASRRSMAAVESALQASARDRLTFTGSGDFHHLTACLLRQFTEPLSLVVFDTHPDWDRTSPWPCCGSWVLEALRMPNVRQVVMIGLGRVDIAGWHINVGRLDALRSGRVAFYPYDCATSWALGIWQIALPCATIHKRLGYSEIRWTTVSTNDWDTLIEAIIAGLPTGAIYLSVDKDCLREEAAITNWETGHLTLDQLAGGIRAFVRAKETIGADITGEYSPIEIKNPLFRALSAWDHPKRAKPTAEELLRNEATNLALLAAFGFDQG
jgi:arginase family enzyme